MDESIGNSVVVVALNGETGDVLVSPVWECEDVIGHVANFAAHVCNTWSTSEFTIAVRPINC